MRDSKIAEKQPVIKEIAELLDGAQSAVVVDYRGLTVEQDTPVSYTHLDVYKRQYLHDRQYH